MYARTCSYVQNISPSTVITIQSTSYNSLSKKNAVKNKCVSLISRQHEHEIVGVSPLVKVGRTR